MRVVARASSPADRSAAAGREDARGL